MQIGFWKNSPMLKLMSKRDGEIIEMAAEAAERKRKIVFEESESVQLKSRRLAAEALRNSSSPASSTCESVNSGCGLASCCSSSRLNEMVKESSKFADLERDNEAIAEFSPTSASNSMDSCDRREKTPASKFQAEAGEFQQCKCATVKIPNDAEIEEFFTGAENNLQKQFIHKYNYDIVKDEPIKGHYKWIPVPENSSPK